MESQEEVRFCVWIQWLNDVFRRLGFLCVCVFFFKVLQRSEWQSGKERSAVLPRSSLPISTLSVSFFAVLFTATSTAVWGLVWVIYMPLDHLSSPCKSISMLNVSCLTAWVDCRRRHAPSVAMSWWITDSSRGPFYWPMFNFGTKEQTAEKPRAGYTSCLKICSNRRLIKGDVPLNKITIKGQKVFWFNLKTWQKSSIVLTSIPLTTF